MLFDLDTVKRRQPLEHVAARYVRLRRSGVRLIGLCPFHEEKTPSFTIEPSKGAYRCYGCGRWGDVIDFIQEVEGLTFLDAIERLDATSGAPGRCPDPPSPTAPEQPKAVLTERAAEALRVAVEWWHDALRRHPEALRYLEERGVDQATIEREQIGYAGAPVLLPLRWSSGYLEAAYDLGLIDRYGHDRFAGRIILPELRNGRPIWLTGRLLGALPGQRADERKYLALTGIERPLLGYDAACASQTLRAGAPIIICEGPFDRLAAERWEYTAVALGAAWPSARTMRELRILIADKQNCYLVPDRDRAGHRGMLTMLRRLDLPQALRPGVVRLPLETKDLGELAAHPDGQRILARRVAAAQVARQKHLANAHRALNTETGWSCSPAGLVTSPDDCVAAMPAAPR